MSPAKHFSMADGLRAVAQVLEASLDPRQNKQGKHDMVATFKFFN